MINITLTPTDCIQSVLPTIEAAMETGDVCHLSNIHYLGPFEIAALVTLTKATHLWDAESGKVFHAHPNFRLIGTDRCGVSRTLCN
jgi:hypothetical protein